MGFMDRLAGDMKKNAKRFIRENDPKWHLSLDLDDDEDAKLHAGLNEGQRVEREFAGKYGRNRGFTESELAFLRDWSEGKTGPDKLAPTDREALGQVIEFFTNGEEEASKRSRLDTPSGGPVTNYLREYFKAVKSGDYAKPSGNMTLAEEVADVPSTLGNMVRSMFGGNNPTGRAAVPDAAMKLLGAAQEGTGALLSMPQPGGAKPKDVLDAVLNPEKREGMDAFMRAYGIDPNMRGVADLVVDPTTVFGGSALKLKKMLPFLRAEGAAAKLKAGELAEDLPTVLRNLADLGDSQRGAAGAGGRKRTFKRGPESVVGDFDVPSEKVARKISREEAQAAKAAGRIDSAAEAAGREQAMARAAREAEAHADDMEREYIKAYERSESEAAKASFSGERKIASAEELAMRKSAAQEARAEAREARAAWEAEQAGATAPIEMGDLVGGTRFPTRAAMAEAERALNRKLVPNTVQDLQRANIISKSEGGLGQQLGVKAAGEQNDLLGQLKKIADKADSLPPPGATAGAVPDVARSAGQVMKEAWGKAMKNLRGGHAIAALDDLVSAAGLRRVHGAAVDFSKKYLPTIRRGLYGPIDAPENMASYLGKRDDEMLVIEDLSKKVMETMTDDVTEDGAQILEGLMRGIIDPKDLQRTDENVAILRKFADARETVDRLGEMAVEMDLLKNEAFMQRIGKYLPQYYQGDKKGMFSRALESAAGIIGDRFRKRKIDWNELALTQEGRNKLKSMGAIRNPAYSTARATADIGHDVVQARLSKRIAGDATLASGKKVDGWEQLSGKKYGALDGMWVNPDVASHMKQIHSYADRNWMLKMYDDMLGAWKAGKTVWNPGTWARNGMMNGWMFEGATGRSWLDPRQSKWLLEGVRGFRKGDDLWKELDRAGLFKGNADQMRETREMLEEMLSKASKNEGFLDVMRKVTKMPGQGYRGMDNLNRYLLARHALSEGKTIREAAKFARKHGIDYGAVGPWIQNMSRVIPFIKYPSKAIPLIAEYAANRPITMAKYPAILSGMAVYAKHRFGWTDEDDEESKKLIEGSWMKDRVSYLLPFKDDEGRAQYLDTSFFVPDTNMNVFSGPIGSLAGLALNKDEFTGKDIVTDADRQSGRAWFKWSDYLTKKMLPSLTPGPGLAIPAETGLTPRGGYSADKLASTLREQKDYMGRTRDLPRVLADIMLGIKVMPVDFTQEAVQQNAQKANQIRALKTQARTWQRQMDESRSEFEKKKLAANIKRNLETIARLESEVKTVDDIPGSSQAPAKGSEETPVPRRPVPSESRSKTRSTGRTFQPRNERQKALIERFKAESGGTR